MQTSQVLLLLVPTVLVCCVCARSLPDYPSYSHNRLKRQFADIEMGQHQADQGLGKLSPEACTQYGCGLVNLEKRQKRTGSDQRIAELQALMALTNGHGAVGHGHIDPVALGKRKRSDDYIEAEDYDDIRRLRLLQKVLDTLNGDAS